MMASKNLNPQQIRGILKAGDIVVPAFSETKYIYQVDRILDFMAEHDRADFAALMSVFGFLPKPVLKMILTLAEGHRFFPGKLGTTLRLLSIGVKGVIFTMYYSDLEPKGNLRQRLGWETNCGDPLVSCANGNTSTDVANFYNRSRSAQDLLRRMSVNDRLTYIRKLKEVVLASRDKVLDEIQAATKKSRSDALMSEFFPVLDHLDYLEKNAQKNLSERKVKTSLALMGKTSRIWMQPLGTVLVICPWNYPFYQALVPTTLAFVCGNAVLYKPSEHTPLEGLLESLLDAAGFDPNWIQIIYGSGAEAEALIDGKPDKIFFIGSTKTGRKVMERAAKFPIPVELELGGKDSCILFDDVNLERAVAGVLWGALTNTGQSCTSIERVYVQRPLYEKFKSELVRRAHLLTYGVDAKNVAGTRDVGAMTTSMQVEIVAQHLDDALAKGASQLTGKSWDHRSSSIPVLLLEKISDEMRLAREESFGPIIPLEVFDTEEEVISRSNQSEFGLSASVWSADLNRAKRVAASLHVGNVSINNVMLTEGNHALPFGGVKGSGFGRYKGPQGFETFSNIKAVIWEKNSAKIEPHWYPFTPEKFQAFCDMTAGYFGKGLMNLIRFLKYGLKLESLAQKAWKNQK